MSNLFPLDADFSIYSTEDEVNYDHTDRQSYLFDFEKGEFVKNPDGTLVKCSAKIAHRQWCQKVMLTPRFEKLAYPDYYGNEQGTVINSDMSDKAIELEIERMVKDALLVHPKTNSVSNFEFIWDRENESLTYFFVITDVENERFELENKIKY